MRRLLIGLFVLCGCARFGWALTLEERTLICPITERPFKVKLIPNVAGGIWQVGAPGPADMGTDEDGCRHDSGFTEYELHVITSPWCYFTSLGMEWDDKGVYRGHLRKEFKEWIRGPEISGEWIIDRNQSYNRFRRRYGSSGVKIPDQNDWEIPQNEIPIEKKYRLALRCYEKRHAPARMMGRMALMGVWAVRTHLCKPFMDPSLAGGVQEVNDKLQRHIEEGEKFSRDKWAKIYQDIFEKESLTDSGYAVAGFTHMGFLVRQGNQQAALEVLQTMLERFADEREHLVYRALIRNRRVLLNRDYRNFLRVAAADFVRALAAEEIPITRMVPVVLAMAELRRRLGDLRGAMDWYTCLAAMPATEPQMRADWRREGGAPAPEAKWLIHVGWQADVWKGRLKELGIQDTGKPMGEAAPLINAIMHEGLGTPEYVNPKWQPVRDKPAEAVAWLMKEVGANLLIYQDGVKVFPDTLDDMWLDGYVKDRNVLNRFRCPQTGEPFLYMAPVAAPMQQTILISTQKPVVTSDGPRYVGFLYGHKVVFSKDPLIPGKLHTK